MLVGWLTEAGLRVLDLVLGVFSFFPTVDFPAGLSLVIPVPIVGSAGVAALNAWIGTAIAVVVALVIGKVLQWLYGLVPFKGT